jgi:hypothetical protein
MPGAALPAQARRQLGCSCSLCLLHVDAEQWEQVRRWECLTVPARAGLAPANHRVAVDASLIWLLSPPTPLFSSCICQPDVPKRASLPSTAASLSRQRQPQRRLPASPSRNGRAHGSSCYYVTEMAPRRQPSSSLGRREGKSPMTSAQTSSCPVVGEGSFVLSCTVTFRCSKPLSLQHPTVSPTETDDRNGSGCEGSNRPPRGRGEPIAVAWSRRYAMHTPLVSNYSFTHM